MEDVIKSADDALYDAKKKSRNVVVPGKSPEGYVPLYESKPVPSTRKRKSDDEGSSSGAA